MFANRADPDQTAPEEQSDLGLQCLLRGSVQISRVNKVDGGISLIAQTWRSKFFPSELPGFGRQQKLVD